MENEQKLNILKSKKSGAEHDLQSSTYELEFYTDLSDDAPDFAMQNKEHYQEEVILNQKKVDWLDLKIEELTAIIENTN
jgi:hypothetical protein